MGKVLTQRSGFGGTNGRAVRFTDCGWNVGGLGLDVSTPTVGFGTHHDTVDIYNGGNGGYGWPYEQMIIDSQARNLAKYSPLYVGYGPDDYDDFKHFWSKGTYYGYESGYGGEAGYGYAPHMIWPSRSSVAKFEDSVNNWSMQAHKPDETNGEYRLILDSEFATSPVGAWTLSAASQVKDYWGDLENYAPLISMRFYTPSQMSSSSGSWSNGSIGNAKFFLEGLGYIYFFGNCSGPRSTPDFIGKFADGSHLSLGAGSSPLSGGSGPLCIPTCDFAMKYYAYPSSFNGGYYNHDDWRWRKYEHFFQIKNYTHMAPTLAYHGILVLVPNAACVKSGGRLKIRCTVNGGTSDESIYWMDFIACKIRYSKLMFDEGNSGYSEILGYGAFLSLRCVADGHSNGGGPGYSNNGASFNFNIPSNDYNGINYYNSGGWT